MSFTRLAVGALTGLVGLIAMIRLISGGFDGRVSMLAWAFILLAMIPWVAYTAWRGQRSRMSGRAALVATALGVAGLVLVWMSTLGPVLALTCSLAAFVVLWVHDWPPRRLRVADHFVGVEDLADRD
jgi:hypothetical protein